VGLFTTSNQKPRGAPFIVNMAIRSEAEGREIVKVLDPEREGIDIEDMLKEVAQRGERTERMRR
jgi:prophage DNA circulation protein